MVGSFASNSHLWGHFGVRVMAIFVSHADLDFPNIDYFEVYMEVYEGIWGLSGVYEGI